MVPLTLDRAAGELTVGSVELFPQMPTRQIPQRCVFPFPLSWIQ
jgi:hypothetical protein